MFTYDIASREVAYRVLSSQRHGAEHDEDQDEVGEDLMVDQLVAEHAKTRAERKTRQKKGTKSGFVRHLELFSHVVVVVCHCDSRVRAAEDEEGAAHRDGRRLLFDGELGQPLRTRP